MKTCMEWTNELCNYYFLILGNFTKEIEEFNLYKPKGTYVLHKCVYALHDVTILPH
jgi:hypothetical protein